MKIKQFIFKYSKQLIIGSLLLILFLSGLIIKNTKPNNQKPNIINNESFEEQILVSIDGEVKYPNNYYITKNSLVEDLIDLAGGLTVDANTSYINLKKVLLENEHIYIPKGNIDNKKINVNTASLDELTTLNGIGESKAYNIILYRTINGPFNKYDDLLKVEGITSKILSEIVNEITLS